MISLMVGLAAMGAVEVQTHTVKDFKTEEQCHKAGAAMMQVFMEADDMPTIVAQTYGIAILENNKGDQIAIYCIESEMS